MAVHIRGCGRRVWGGRDSVMSARWFSLTRAKHTNGVDQHRLQLQKENCRVIMHRQRYL